MYLNGANQQMVPITAGTSVAHLKSMTKATIARLDVALPTATKNGERSRWDGGNDGRA